MALDEPQENDEVYDIGSFKYVVDKELLEKAKPIKIDFMGNGFSITSSMVFDEGGCGGCGAPASPRSLNRRVEYVAERTPSPTC